MFRGRFDRARAFQKEQMQGRDLAYDDVDIEDKLEKHDTLAMVLAALLTILPAALLAIGIPTLYHNWFAPQSQYIAYVNGMVIKDNKQAVMTLIEQDLNNMGMATRELDNVIASDMSDMGDATRLMTDELSSLGDAIELDD